MARNDLRNMVQGVLGDKQDVQKVWFGVLGNAAGTVIVPGKTSYVYVTLPDGMPVEAYNTSVPTILNLPVVIGFDPTQRRSDLLRVLDIRDTPRQGNTTAAYFVDRHHASHEWMNSAGGTDVVYVQLRQFVPLRPSIVEPFGVNIARDVQLINSTWTEVGGVTTDLTAYVPGFSGSAVAQERFVTLSMSPTSGSITATSGSLSTTGSSTMGMVPAAPSGDYAIAAVRLYTDQIKITEAQTSTDLIDLRWNIFSSLTTAHNSLSGLQGGTTDEYYHLTAAQHVIAGYTSGSNTGDQDVPGDHSPVSDFYLTGYNATSGSFASGSVVGGGGSGAVTLIAEVSGSGVSLGFSSIPDTYTSLLVVISGRTDRAATSDWIMMQVNGNSTPDDHAMQYLWAQASTVVGTENVTNETSARVMLATGATAAAQYFGGAFIRIYDYTDTTKAPHWTSQGAWAAGVATSNLFISTTGGILDVAGVVDQLDFSPEVGSNLAVGTKISLYGVE